MSMNTEIGALLASVRDAAKITQVQLAKSLGTSQTRISRIEAGEGVSNADCDAYLDRISTPEAERAKVMLRVVWTHLPRPPLQHPDIDQLIAAEAALARLADFLSSESVPRAIAGQAELLSRRIYDFGDFLRSLKHSVAWVGDIGVGKTTAACRQAGLVLSPATATDLRGVILDTGGGRVTLCEVSVVTSTAFALEVDPLPDEEVYRLVADFCRSVWVLKDLDPDAPAPNTDFKLPEETERALRNMCELARPPRRKGVANADPALQLLKAFSDLEDFKAEVAARLTLWRRTRRQIAFEGTDNVPGRQWLKDTFAAINNGRHPEFSLPGRMTVTVPFSIFHGAPYEVELIDTRGVDQSAVRPDIVAQLKDRRTVSVLCSRFNSAPDVALQSLVQHLMETEVDPNLKSRAVLLVLARPGEALAMRDDSGVAAADVGEGYDIKRGHVEDALAKIGGRGIEVEFFDSTGDDPDGLTAVLAQKIAALRAAQAAGLGTAIEAVDQMLANVARAQALAVVEEINNELRIFAGRHRALRPSQVAVYSRLINALRDRHPRTVWASTRRKGQFWNFDVYQHLGDGAAAEAKRRAAPVVQGLREIIENKLANAELSSAHGFLGQLLEYQSAWETDFVAAARHHATSIYRPSLSAAEALWDGCEDKYGRGLTDYRSDVARAVETWFRADDDLAESVERHIQRAWQTAFVEPLLVAAGGTTHEEPAP